MRNTKYLIYLLIVSCLLAFNTTILAQPHEVAPLTEIISYISGDTTATGERNHTEYGLQRGSVYFTLGQLQNDYPLKIVAVGDESLDRPFIKILVNESGESTYPFKLYDDITVEGISFSGINSAGTSSTSYIFRTGADNLKATINDCEFDSLRIRVIRVDHNGCSIFASDCIAHNFGTSNFNGRFIDGRSALLDSVVVQNCTFYNFYHTVINKFGGWERYVKFDHITVYNLMRSPLRIVECPDITVTNSLFIQTGFIGCEDSWKTFRESPEYALTDRDHWTRIEIAPLVQDTFLVDLGLTQQIDFTNNNFWLDKSVYEVFADTVHPYMNVDIWSYDHEGFDALRALIAPDTLTWISEDPNFVKAPVVKSKAMHDSVFAGGVADGVGFGYDPPYDFSYPTSSASYTAAAGEFPLGDLNWFPDKKAEWEDWVETDVKTAKNKTAPAQYKLAQNYPNPFNPSTNIAYTIQKANKVSLDVYNVLGQKVRSLVDKKQIAGSYSVAWDGCDDSGETLSGAIYFYKLKVDTQTLTKKMLLIK